MEKFLWIDEQMCQEICEEELLVHEDYKRADGPQTLYRKASEPGSRYRKCDRARIQYRGNVFIES